MGYPQHEKLQGLDGRNQEVGNFLEWLQGKGLVVCRWSEDDWGSCPECGDYGRYCPEQRSISSFLADYIEKLIEEELKQEKLAMLEKIRRGR